RSPAVSSPTSTRPLQRASASARRSSRIPRGRRSTTRRTVASARSTRRWLQWPEARRGTDEKDSRSVSGGCGRRVRGVGAGRDADDPAREDPDGKAEAREGPLRPDLQPAGALPGRAARDADGDVVHATAKPESGTGKRGAALPRASGDVVHATAKPESGTGKR